MIVQKETRDELRKVAEEMNLPYELVREVFYSQFKFLRSEISQGTKGDPSTFRSVFLRYFGTFHPIAKEIEHITKNVDKDGRE